MFTPEDVTRAIEGDSASLQRLVAGLRPVVQARVARTLLRRGAGSRGRNVRQEVEDLTQEVFLELFESGAKILRSWNPSQGLSLLNFVGLVAERLVVTILRSGRRSAHREDPTVDEALERYADGGQGGGRGLGGAPDPLPELEDRIASSEVLGLVLDRLQEELSPLGMSLFDLLFIQEASVQEVCEKMRMSPEAVYTWRSRLSHRASVIYQKIVSEITVSSRNLPMGA